LCCWGRASVRVRVRVRVRVQGFRKRNWEIRSSFGQDFGVLGKIWEFWGLGKGKGEGERERGEGKGEG
jgi:hypothetical protein